MMRVELEIDLHETIFHETICTPCSPHPSCEHECCPGEIQAAHEAHKKGGPFRKGSHGCIVRHEGLGDEGGLLRY